MTHTETITATFRVESLTEQDIWLKQTSDGLTAAIERNAPEYNDELQIKLGELSPGDVIEANLQAQNFLLTRWHFLEVAHV